jgi:adenylate cyclase
MEESLPRTRRRLAAVLVADVVGSSRLMSHDEQAALAAIQALVSEVIEPAARKSEGRLVKTMGDGAMLEFASPVDAVLCAVEIQEAASERALAAPP